MVKIIFTAHAQGKFTFFKRHKFKISKHQVTEAIQKGKVVDTSEYPKLQSAGRLDESHSLVVI